MCEFGEQKVYSVPGYNSLNVRCLFTMKLPTRRRLMGNNKTICPSFISASTPHPSIPPFIINSKKLLGVSYNVNLCLTLLIGRDWRRFFALLEEGKNWNKKSPWLPSAVEWKMKFSIKILPVLSVLVHGGKKNIICSEFLILKLFTYQQRAISYPEECCFSSFSA